MVLETVAGVAAIEPRMQLVLSLCSLVTMVSVLTACVCCKKPMKHREEDLEEAYGVIPADDPTSPRVNFRFGNGHTGERHSQPASKPSSSSLPFGPRTSAPIHHHPPRALPPIPAEEDGVSALYAQIDKRGKSAARDDIEYADGGDGPTGTYGTIDYEDDIDQLYGRVGPRAAHCYDYPQFKRTPPLATNAASETRKEQRPSTDPPYQSASQLYGPTASEDPYSSIASGPRTTTRPSADGGDSSSAYDPGYARVRAEGRAGRSSDDVEGELDQLYSKIRRSGSGERPWEREGAEERSNAAIHPSASLTGLPGSRGASTMGGERAERREEQQREEFPRVVPSLVGPPSGLAPLNADDEQSIASRDPSYRYITVRESAETIRARLEREQRLPPGPPQRDQNYYSTIGSDRLYESVDDVPPSSVPPSSSRPLGGLAVDTASPSSAVHPPLPPTSPIPDRNALQAAAAAGSGVSPGRSQGPTQQQLYTAINKPKAGSKSPSPRPLHPGNGSAPARSGDHTSTTPAHNATSSPTDAAATAAAASRSTARSPFGNARHATIVKPEDDGFEDGPKVVRRPPQQQRTPSEERSTVASGDGPTRKESEERSSVARYDVDLRKREQSPGRLKRDSSEDRSTQTVQRPSVVQDNDQLRDRRASPITVSSSPGIPLMNGTLPPSMVSSIDNAYGIDSSRSIIDPMSSSLLSESMALPEERMTTSVTTRETTSTDPSGKILSRRVVEERETICERRSTCSSRSSSSVHFAASEDEMECGGTEEWRASGAYSARAGGPRVRHDSGGSQSARYSSLERRRVVVGEPGPEFTHGGDRIYRVPIHLTDSTQSLGREKEEEGTRSSRSSRSALPRRQSSEELRAAHARSRQRRESAERASPAAPDRVRSGATTPNRASSRARREEEAAKRATSSIYTGRDYVSPIDMTTQRGWPLVGPSSPPSLRRGETPTPAADADLTPRAPLQPTSGRGSGADRVNNNTTTPRKQPPPPIVNGIFTCDLSSSEESLVARRAKFGGASGAEADSASHASHCPAARRARETGAGGADADFACYCHTPGAQRADVWRSNHQEMDNIGYGRLLEEEIC
ncbi:hypothetical protein PMAYCL1PPCAC_01875 [Pristionchus mayeri]|uniref:Uncharacterized protein n=1 Tax=Pristionchus mayeri TaxID=1317129 RepID=A0AAN4Z733_9BILA|nr:hypothetical protein PMAYCL1PPCAC_01875 [Pristionchus mayeri]